MRLEHKDRFMGYPTSRWHRWVLALVLAMGVGAAQAQTVSFNFSATSSTWPGWVNVAGDPSVAVQTATANGITLSSVATANWSPYDGYSAQNGSGWYPGSYFPARVMSGNWFNYNGTGRSLALYNALAPQIKLSGFNPDSTYILQISASDGGSFNTDPTQYTVVGKMNYGTQNLNAHNNATQGVVFQGIAPDSTGTIRLYVNATTSTDLAPICGIQVYPGYYGVGSPAVTITAPANGAITAEGDNVTILATALEVAATISKVEFYADTTKIGEVDASPYNFTWQNPDPGAYTVTAKATDNLGTVNSASVSIAVKTLNYYWSTTGNVGNNADSTFIGNVDSVRLDLRTKDIQRMSIGATGNIGIGTISPTAQLHVTGKVRLAGLVNDSANVDPRVIFSDSNGNLAYRSAADLGSAVGGGLGITGTNVLTLGDSIAGPGAHNFTANRDQYLNSYYYSIGGSVSDPVKEPVFRWYNNGDLVSGTTMDLTLNTNDSTGFRYYNKLGLLEIGATNRPDTTQSKIITGSWQGSGLMINTDNGDYGARLLNSIYLADDNNVDAYLLLINSLMALEEGEIAYSGAVTNSLLVGYGQNVWVPMSNSTNIGDANLVNYPVNACFIGGYVNSTNDTAWYCTVAGADNQYGGLGQFTMGQYLKNRAPFGAVLGNSNVDFTSLSYTGTQGVRVSGIAGYPLFAFGNSSSGSGSTSSNAITVLYNGRTQINTTGFGSTLTQTVVTPKAALEVVSTNSGVLLPKLNTGQRGAIATADLQSGLLLYNTDSGSFQFFNGAVWDEMTRSGSAASGWAALGNTGSNPAANFIGTTDSEAVVFRTDDTARMTILASGTVGIGTAVMPASDAQLAIDGSLYSTNVEVTLAGWPDYVFDKGYSLPSLASLAGYIRQHRHLPGISSSGEVREKGLDLGDNQAALLKKVEELTLYLIEAHKGTVARQEEIEQLKAQAKRVNDQQQEIDRLREMLEQLAARNKNELHK
jgi:hypothetical protein